MLSLPVSGSDERHEIRDIRGAATEGVARIAHEKRKQHRPYRNQKLRLDALRVIVATKKN